MMNQTHTLMDKCLAAVSLAALATLHPSQGWAAVPGALPWDYTLNVIEDFVTGPVADVLIVAYLISAGILFAVDGHAALGLGAMPRSASLPTWPSTLSTSSTTYCPNRQSDFRKTNKHDFPLLKAHHETRTYPHFGQMLVMLRGELKASLVPYAKYYEHVDSVDPRALIHHSRVPRGRR